MSDALDTKPSYSETEQKIEEIANKHSKSPRLAINQLDALLQQQVPANDLAYLLAYRCYLATANQLNTEIEKSLSLLQSNQISANHRSSLTSALQFCLGWQSFFQQENSQYEAYVQTAFNQSHNSQSTILNYWIAITAATINQNHAQHNEAINTAEFALTLALEHNDGYRAATARTMLALSENELGYDEQALAHNDLAIEYHKKNSDEYSLIELYQNRGYIFLSQDQLDKAEAIYQEAIELATKLDYQYALNSIQTNLAAIEFRRGDLKKSNQHALIALEYSSQVASEYLAAYANGILGVNYVYLNQLELATKHYGASNAYFKKNNRPDDLADNYLAWATAMAHIGQYKEAYLAHTRYKQQTDIIFNAERELGSLRTKLFFQATQKDLEIERLAASNKQQALALQNKQLERRLWLLIGCLIILICLAIFLRYHKIKQNNALLYMRNKELDNERYVDPLTKIYNRRYFDNFVSQLSLDSNSYQLLLVDIDHFKKVNDSYGHLVGDQVLIEFCQRISASIRDSDIFIRIGGEEFLLILEGNNKYECLIRKLLSQIASSQFQTSSGPLSITTSIGCLSYQPDEHSIHWQALIDIADKALYLAKEKGRNRGIAIKYSDVDQNEFEMYSTIQNDDA